MVFFPLEIPWFFPMTNMRLSCIFVPLNQSIDCEDLPNPLGMEGFINNKSVQNQPCLEDIKWDILG